MSVMIQQRQEASSVWWWHARGGRDPREGKEREGRSAQRPHLQEELHRQLPLPRLLAGGHGRGVGGRLVPLLRLAGNDLQLTRTPRWLIHPDRQRGRWRGRGDLLVGCAQCCRAEQNRWHGDATRGAATDGPSDGQGGRAGLRWAQAKPGREGGGGSGQAPAPQRPALRPWQRR